MSYADDLLDHSPEVQREGFTNFKHWRVIQVGLGGGTTNWFTHYPEAAQFRFDHGGELTGVSCEDFESVWPEDWREPHMHGGGSDGERPEATKPTPRADARRSQRSGRLV